jgi:hypothetical protein
MNRLVVSAAPLNPPFGPGSVVAPIAIGLIGLVLISPGCGLPS